MTLNEAIAHAKEIAATKCDECGKEHAKLAEWLQKLADYEDKTYIEAEWLEKNGFERQNYDTFLYCNDAEEISARIVDTEVGIWEVLITFLDHGDIEELNICTLGQFRMFLAICGLDNLVNEFK